MKKVNSGIALGLLVALAISACATDEYGRSRPLTNAETGAIVGSVGGALAGAAINHRNRGKGALIGAVGGGLAGVAVGSYMDNQRKDLEKVLAGEREVGAIDIDRLPDHVLRVTMTGATAFDTNSTAIKSGFMPTLNRIADVVNRYGKTSLTIVGHTDSVGSDASNMDLSNRRAQAVEQYLEGQRVHPERLTAYGKGESEPRTSNDSEQGRALNRRVEVLIVPVVQG
ncbi:OmpA family protein [Chitinivorax sp. PXF-14]|uniref:OmpA family protein n=1 Tax=Chitinivorax sp. PXF-14 TaxID=3230488 RepID=UPI003467CBCB